METEGQTVLMWKQELLSAPRFVKRLKMPAIQGVYASKNWLTGKLDAQKLLPYSVWLAQYSGKPSYQGTYDMWQYTSAGTVDGISTLVDFNVSYMDY